MSTDIVKLLGTQLGGVSSYPRLDTSAPTWLCHLCTCLVRLRKESRGWLANGHAAVNDQPPRPPKGSGASKYFKKTPWASLRKTCSRTTHCVSTREEQTEEDEEVVDLAGRIGNTSPPREARTSFCIVRQKVPEIAV